MRRLAKILGRHATVEPVLADSLPAHKWNRPSDVPTIARMHDRSRHPPVQHRTAPHDQPAPTTRAPRRGAPRTLGGLLVCLTLPAALGLPVVALAAPVVLVAAVAGFCAGAATALAVAARRPVAVGPVGETSPG